MEGMPSIRDSWVANVSNEWMTSREDKEDVLATTTPPHCGMLKASSGMSGPVKGQTDGHPGDDARLPDSCCKSIGRRSGLGTYKINWRTGSLDTEEAVPPSLISCHHTIKRDKPTQIPFSRINENLQLIFLNHTTFCRFLRLYR